MTSLLSVALQSPEPDTTTAFYDAFLGPDAPVVVRAGDAPTSGFRGFTLSLVVAQPGTVDLFLDAALRAGAAALKPAAKNLWGYGGVVQAPDGAIWKVACSSTKDKGPVTREVEQHVLLLGCSDVKATKQFYVERGLTVDKSYGSKYVQFDGTGSAVTLGLYGRKALAKDAGVGMDGDGSHRLAVLTDGGSFTDPDGFTWEPAS
jgi:catechol 2,3-dioxygenase-like lactoylglutathione lyase family enzyme